MNSPCTCGDPHSDHADQISDLPDSHCEVYGCECIEFTPLPHLGDSTPPPPGRQESQD